MSNWQTRIFAEDAQEYVRDINDSYDALAGQTTSKILVDLRLMRSLWAKKSMASLLDETFATRTTSLTEYTQLLRNDYGLANPDLSRRRQTSRVDAKETW